MSGRTRASAYPPPVPTQAGERRPGQLRRRYSVHPHARAERLSLAAGSAQNSYFAVSCLFSARTRQEDIMFVQTLKTGLMAAAAATALLVAIPTAADAQSTGRVSFRVASAGFIIGGGGGTGTLNFKGKSYPLRVSGLSAGTIGIASAEFVGTARNLRTAQDIAGTYSAAGAGVTVAGGVSAVTLQNAKGVQLQLRGRQAGFSATLGVGGVTITMQ
jgi:hypothetical protein